MSSYQLTIDRHTLYLREEDIWMLACLLNTERDRCILSPSDSWAHLDHQQYRCESILEFMHEAGARLPELPWLQQQEVEA